MTQQRQQGRWTQGPSLDGMGEFKLEPARPFGEEPRLGPPDPLAFAEAQQMMGEGSMGTTATASPSDD